MRQITRIHYARALASIAVCILGGWCMYVSHGSTGVGWAILGIALIWGS